MGVKIRKTKNIPRQRAEANQMLNSRGDILKNERPFIRRRRRLLLLHLRFFRPLKGETWFSGSKKSEREREREGEKRHDKYHFPITNLHVYSRARRESRLLNYVNKTRSKGIVHLN